MPSHGRILQLSLRFFKSTFLTTFQDVDGVICLDGTTPELCQQIVSREHISIYGPSYIHLLELPLDKGIEVVIRAHAVDDALGQLVEVMVLPVWDVPTKSQEPQGSCIIIFGGVITFEAAGFIGASLPVLTGLREPLATPQAYQEVLVKGQTRTQSAICDPWWVSIFLELGYVSGGQ